MPKPQWRTFSIRVGPRKSVAVQALFPLTPDEWAALFAGLEKVWADEDVFEATSVLQRIDVDGRRKR